MGKSLIIKGADFSENGIPTTNWFMDNYHDAWAIQTVDDSYYSFAPGNYADVQGKTINCIKLKVAAAGTMSIGLADGVGGSANVSMLRSVEFTSEEVDTVVTKTFQPLEVPQTGVIVIYFSGDTGKTYYASNLQSGSGGNGYYSKVGNGGNGELKVPDIGDLNFSLGYYKE